MWLNKQLKMSFIVCIVCNKFQTARKPFFFLNIQEIVPSLRSMSSLGKVLISFSVVMAMMSVNVVLKVILINIENLGVSE
jgi:hypothetical protein